MFQKYRVVEELEKADGNRISFTFTLADDMFAPLPDTQNHFYLL